MIPNKDEFLKGISQYQKHEPRDLVYKISLYYLEKHWNIPDEMTDALIILLLSWNKAFYNYGELDYKDLEKNVNINLDIINNFKKRSILTINKDDELVIKSLFKDFLSSSKIKNKDGIRVSPVSVTKIMHLLAPNFFPLWDKAIAKNYNCDYSIKPEDIYISFCYQIKKFAESIDYKIKSEKTLVKLIDKYNYVKYTKKWI